MRKFFYCTVLLLAFSASAYCQDACPSPTVQLATDVKGKIEGDIETWLKLGKIKTVGDIETKTQDFFHLYPDANSAALEQNTLSIICSKVLPSSEYSREFKQEIIRKLVDKIVGDSKKINWKTYNFRFVNNLSPESNLSAPSVITIAYPDDWTVNETDPDAGAVFAPMSNSDYGDYGITFGLQVLGSTAEASIGNLKTQVKTPEGPIVAEIADYKRELQLEKEVEQHNAPEQNVTHMYKVGKIKVNTGADFEYHQVLFDVATEGNNMRVVSFYIDPFMGYSKDGPQDVLISRFECKVPKLFSRICDWVFSRIIIQGSTELAD